VPTYWVAANIDLSHDLTDGFHLKLNEAIHLFGGDTHPATHLPYMTLDNGERLFSTL